jgi:uncharacterized protein (DUF924 family)
MTAARRRWAAELLHFWFHHLRPRQWFGRNDEVDAALRRRFGRDLRMLAGQPARRFCGNRETARAAVLLFDQVPRNLYRDSAAAFAHDRLAREIVRHALRSGWHRGLGGPGRQFLYMPLMHSEQIGDQRLALRLFAALDAGTFRFARAHARMIARFGRFPHRNAALGRLTSPAEARAIAAGNRW